MTRLQVTEEQWAHKMELMEGDNVVSRLYVRSFEQRIGVCWVRMGGIAGVNTPPQYRIKGYARELLEQTVNWMTNKGFHWTGLFGIANFYYRFGYVSALPEGQVTIPTRNAEAAKLSHRVRPWQANDIPVTLEIYAATNAERTGVVKRIPGTWSGFTKAGDWSSIPAVDVIEDAAGQVVGYAVYDKYSDRVAVAEIAATSLTGYESLLSHLAQLAVERRSESIAINVVPDHPVARLCQHFGCTHTTTYPIRRAGMWRVLNQTALFQAIEAELSRRLQRAGYKQKVNLTLATELGQTTLLIDGGKVQVSSEATPAASNFSIHVSQTSLTQALMGFIPLSEALARMTSTGTASSGADSDTGQLQPAILELCDMLFPRQYAMLWGPDHF